MKDIKEMTDVELMEYLAGLSGEAIARGLIKGYPPMGLKGFKIVSKYLIENKEVEWDER